MAMKLDDWKNMRSKWTAARDHEKVSKGAVSGVSLGDAIDLIVKATPNGLTAVRAAIVKLLDKTKKYKAGITKKSPNLVKWIEANLETPARELDKACDDAIIVLKRTGGVVGKAVSTSFGMLKDAGHFNDLNKRAQKEQKDWYDLAKGEIDKHATAAQICGTAAQVLTSEAEKFEVEVPGKPSPKAEYKKIADRLQAMRDGFLALSKPKTFSDYLAVIAAARQSGWMGSGQQDQNELADWANQVAKEQGAL